MRTLRLPVSPRKRLYRGCCAALLLVATAGPVAAGVAAASPPAPPAAATAAAGSTAPTWRAEFTSGLGDFGPADINLGCAPPENSWVSDGLLHLKYTTATSATDRCRFTRAVVATQSARSFGYGRIAVRALWDVRPGAKSAMWMLPEGTTAGGPRGGAEIDMPEITSWQPGLHFRLWGNTASGARCRTVSDHYLPSGWHTYWLQRSAERMEMGIDDTTLAEFTRSEYLAQGCSWPSQPVFIILTENGDNNYAGPVHPELLPYVSQVDWVRYWAS